MAQRREEILARVTSLCARPPFAFGISQSPFDFDLQPSGNIDQVCRLTIEAGEVIGGLNYCEDQIDNVTIWIARKLAANPHEAQRVLVADVTSLRSAVIRDGSTGGGDFHVPDGGGLSLDHAAGQEFAVARFTLPINYEVQV